jgi:hypothetical protein
LPVVNIEGDVTSREVVFDLEQRLIRWQPVDSAPVSGAAGVEGDLYAARVELPVGASLDFGIWSSPVCRELTHTLFEGAEVVFGEEGTVAVWCSDAAFHAWRRLLSASFRWTVARDTERVRSGIVDSTVEAFKEAVLRSGDDGQERWARIEAGRDPKTGTFPWLQVESVRIA